MAWNLDESKRRVRNRAEACKTSDYTVVDLTRERDFYKLSPTTICRVKGAHVYADVTNSHLLVADAGGDKHEQKKLIRGLSVLRRMQGELADESDVGKIQMQAARFHGMCHKPYDGNQEDNEAGRARCAVIFGITTQSYLYDVFNDVFDDLKNFRGAVGIDSGRFLVANIGSRGDRELISLGSPANIAGKAIGESGTITVTKRVFDLLPECLQEHFIETDDVAGVEAYQASGLRWKSHPELAEELDVTFDHDRWKKNTQEAKDNLVLADMNVSGVEGPINIDALSESNSKGFNGGPFYADLDGFTACVQAAEKDDDVKSLVRAFHLIRQEFQSVIEGDFDGLAIQHQGDCVLGIGYLPAGSDQDNRRRRKALDIAIGLQSSMEHVLQDYVGTRVIHLAVGVAAGNVLLTRLGKKGERELVALSPPVDDAQRLQKKSGAKQTRISQSVYDAINDDVIRDQFSKSGDSYIATDLTFPNLEKLNEEEEEKAADHGSLGVIASGAGLNITTKSLAPARPYAPNE
jgi:class 3 adenylate cyclase